ncbi:MAG TPA: ATP-binding protein [Streptosporangiaceae bacterium]
MSDPLFAEEAAGPHHPPDGAGAPWSVIAVVLGGAVRTPRTLRCETFPATTDQVGRARRAARQALGDHPQGEQAVLLVSELTTNVVRHSRGARSFTLVIAETDDRDVWVAVADDAVGDTIPQLCLAGPTDTGGRGLRIIDRLATRWGITRAQQRCAVWCHMTYHAGRAAPATTTVLRGAARW